MSITIEDILEHGNINVAINRVVRNGGAPGIDGVNVLQIDQFMRMHEQEINDLIRNRLYKPKPVKRVYIPKPNSAEKRPLGIPCCVDRVYQMAVVLALEGVFDPTFSEHSHGFRPKRSCHTAMTEALGYLNEGCEWVVDFDIQKFFDTVNHDKLISFVREKVNDGATLHLIRAFLKSGIMDNGLESPTEQGVPQGGPLSPLLSNIYLDKLDKELEARGLRFCRYADDFNIFVKSEEAANRVMKSVTNWIERKLALKVSPTKTKVVRPTKGEFLGFGFWNDKGKWRCKPLNSRKQRLMDKVKVLTCRKKAAAIPLSVTIIKLNQVIRGWINYYRIGNMKGFLDKFGSWLRHKVRVILLKQWKKPQTIIKRLKWYCRVFKIDYISDEEIFKVANTRKGLYAQANGNVINFILSPKVLATRIYIKRIRKTLPGLLDPLKYYLGDKSVTILTL